jgi:hypothetical protein
MISYTWDDWNNLCKYLNIDFSPRSSEAYLSANSMIEYYLRRAYDCYPEALDRLLRVLFDAPFEDLPLIINESIAIDAKRSVLVNKAASWRLSLGK